MDNEIQLISDGDGLAVIGEPGAVEHFLAAEGLSGQDLGLHRLGPARGTGTALNAGAAALRAGSGIAANSGRWVKITKESAQLAKKYGLMENSKTGLKMGVVHAGGKAGIKGILQFEEGPASLVGNLANPALLSGAAGLMAQLAMQQSMQQITDYLAAIDAKVDDVLRAQKDAMLADMIGADFVIREALTVREHVHRVSEVTWSKVQVTSLTIAKTQAYALRQLDALAEKVEHKGAIGDLAEASQEAEAKAPEWLAVLACCFQLQDGSAVLELDRVLDASPEELDQHRIGLRIARRQRLELIATSTRRLMARMNAAAGKANAGVLLHPRSAPAVVHATGQVATAVTGLHECLGIEGDQHSLEARRWVDAVTEITDEALKTGAKGVDVAGRLGTETVGQAVLMTDKLSGEITGRALRWFGSGNQPKKELPGHASEKTGGQLGDEVSGER